MRMADRVVQHLLEDDLPDIEQFVQPFMATLSTSFKSHGDFGNGHYEWEKEIRSKDGELYALILITEQSFDRDIQDPMDLPGNTRGENIQVTLLISGRQAKDDQHRHHARHIVDFNVFPDSRPLAIKSVLDFADHKLPDVLNHQRDPDGGYDWGYTAKAAVRALSYVAWRIMRFHTVKARRRRLSKVGPQPQANDVIRGSL